MNKKELMKKAHEMTKEIKTQYPEVDYRFQFGLCLSFLMNEEENNVEIETWFLKKNFSNSEAKQIASLKKEIIKETAKAALIKAGEKEIWVPKSCLITKEEISARRKAKIEEIKRTKDVAELLRHVSILEDDMKVIADFGAIFEIQRKYENGSFLADDWKVKLYDEDGIFFDKILLGIEVFDEINVLLKEGATLSDLKISKIKVEEGKTC